MAGKKVTKIDLIDAVYLKTGMNRKEIREVIDLFLGEVRETLAGGANVELRGFGTFEVRIRKGKSEARNPRTGGTVAVHSHGVAAFKPGRRLRQEAWKAGMEGAELLSGPAPAPPEAP
ncbi:MAG: HU family DNA-binding protein [Spirochaetaceae bacterium]|jgi:integration host factor subunit beta|nr:HU family DNA-binding protein [Spirochaetaceae bacterium]